MSVKEMIKHEIEKLPENLLQEVLDYSVFRNKKRENAPRKGISGNVLAII